MTRSDFSYFAIFAAMRTGSNLLERNLNQYEGLACHGELFNPVFIGKSGAEKYLGIDLASREADPAKLIVRMIDKSGTDLPGFRIFQGHDPRAFQESVRDPKCAKIILRRRPLDSFVSLKIARATDQWILGNAPKRRSEKIRYDGTEYRDYLRRLDIFETKLRLAIQETGQTAFELRYEDLKSTDVMNGLVKFLGIPDRRGAFDEKIKRQNPEPLSDKVSNYDEMISDLGSLGTDAVQTTHAPENERSFSVRDIVVCQNVPVLFAPVPGVDERPVTHIMGQFDGVGSGTLKTGLNQKELSQWLENETNLVCFSVIDHPLLRAYNIFMSHIHPPEGSAFPKIRRRLKKHFDVNLPDSLTDWTVEKHAASFEAYLMFLKSNLAGQTSIRIDALWEAQHKLTAAISQVQPIGRIIRSDQFLNAMSDLAAEIGQPVPTYSTSKVDSEFLLDNIYSRRLENLARAAYAKDYRMFGFGDWRP